MMRLALAILAVCSLGVEHSNAQEKEIRGLSDQLSQSLIQSGKKTVAVVDFTNLQGNVTELGRYLAEEFSVNLADGDRGIQVIDRTNLRAILQENKLADTGIIDPTSARKLGQIAGVDSLVTGTITPFGDSVHLSIKILDATTARIIGARGGEIPKTKAIEELLGQGVAATGNSPQPQASSNSQPGTKLNQPSMEVEGIRALVDSCRADGQVVTCTLMLTSQLQDMKIRLGAGVWTNGRWVHSEAYDDHGVEYGTNAITFAGKTGYPYSEFEGLLVSGVPTQLVLKFNEFSSSSAKVTLISFRLEVWPSSGGYRLSDFALRNILIQR